MNNRPEANKCNLSTKLQRYDKFGQSFKFLIDDGKDALPSKIGTLCSFLLTFAMVAYTGYKIYILEGKKSIDIIQAVQENYFDDSHVFGL